MLRPTRRQEGCLVGAWFRSRYKDLAGVVQASVFCNYRSRRHMSSSRWQNLGILLLAGIAAVVVGLLYSKGSADSAAQDRQPIPFSHEFHAGQLKLDCLYCHRSAHQSQTAGVPSLQLCMGCHQNIDAKKPASGTFSIIGRVNNLSSGCVCSACRTLCISRMSVTSLIKCSAWTATDRSSPRPTRRAPRPTRWAGAWPVISNVARLAIASRVTNKAAHPKRQADRGAVCTL